MVKLLFQGKLITWTYPLKRVGTNELIQAKGASLGAPQHVRVLAHHTTNFYLTHKKQQFSCCIYEN